MEVIPTESLEEDVKRQVRVLKSSTEEKLQQHVPADHPILTCLQRHGANCLTRYRIGDDGKMVDQWTTGKRWLNPALEFGERLHLRPELAHSRTGSILVGTSEGIVKGRNVGGTLLSS